MRLLPTLRLLVVVSTWGSAGSQRNKRGPAHRRDVLERVMAEGPVAVGAQVIRARLTALPERWSRREDAA